MPRIRTALLALLAALATACGDTVAPEPGEPTALQLLRGGDQAGTAGAPLDSLIVVRVQDSRGTGVGGVPVRFLVVTGGGSIRPEQVLTEPDGTARAEWVLGDLVFTEQRAVAMVLRPGAAPIEMAFTATAAPTGPVAIVTGLSPAVLAPGSTLTVIGDSLQHVTHVTVAGLAATIISRSATSLEARVPAVGYDCMPTDDVPVVLTSASGRVQHLHTMRVAPERSFGVGDVVMSTPGNPLTCIELPPDGGRYLIVIANVSTDTTIAVGARLRGLGAGAGNASPALAAAADASAPPPPLPRRAAHHDRLLWSAAALPAGTAAGLKAAPELRAAVDPVPGDTMTVRIPRIWSGLNPCTAYDQVLTRVAHVGARAVVLEDVTHPFAGALTDLYRELVDEYDNVQYPVLRDNFGEPPGSDERLRIVFSRRVNASGSSGFVSAGDLLPRSACSQSNQAPMFYGFVPTVVGDHYEEGTRAEWWWSIRPTLVHEAQHLTEMRLRAAAGLPPQQPWLDEATAMVAEELWARQVFGYTQLSNTGYAESVGCEIDGAFDREPCRGRPGALFAHFLFLAGWLAQPSTNTMLGPTGATDVSYYGSSWLFLRWLLDHAARPESTLLRELTTSPLTGVPAIEASFGRPFAQLLPQWAAAVALDDRSGFSPPDGYQVPSWDLRDVYSGLNREQPNLFPTTFPLRVRTLAYGNTQTDVPLVRAGGAAYFELAGESGGRQALAFSGARGAPLSDALRIVLVRID